MGVVRNEHGSVRVVGILNERDRILQPATSYDPGLRYDAAVRIHMLAVAGGKGGCGKTTTALGVATALADDRDRRPLIVADADRDMPDLHTLAGVDRTPTLSEVAETGDPPHSAAAPPDLGNAPGVRVLPAPKGIAGPSTARSLAALSTALDVVDCPAGAGPDAVAPLRVADGVLLVARATRESLQDAVKTAAMARELDCDPIGAVLVRIDSVPDGVREGLGVERVWTVPEASGRPLSDSSVRAAYREVGTDLREHGDSPLQ